MKQSVKAVLVLTVLCAVVAAVLGTANYFTAEKIAENNRLALEKARTAVLPAGTYDFQILDLSAYPSAADTVVTAAYAALQNGETVAYVFEMETKGYAPGLVLACGISADGRITGTATVSSGETPSLGGKTERDAYTAQYPGLTAERLDTVDGISGATKTSEAYKNAVRDAFSVYETIVKEKGGQS